MALKLITLAIDPGSSGGIAWQIHGGKSGAASMPDTPIEVVAFLQRVREKFIPGRAVLEQLVKYTGTNVPSSTMAVYASSWGVIYGALLMDGWVVEIVTPQKWQAVLGLGITGRQKANTKGMTPSDAKKEKARVRLLNGQLKYAWKQKLQDEAARLYPHLKVTMKNADALLMLRYSQERLI